MVIFDLLGRSWAIGILWHLSQKHCKFRELQVLCEKISPTTLNKRIKELTHGGLIIRTVDGYALTEQGLVLAGLLSPINSWADKWAENFESNQET